MNICKTTSERLNAQINFILEIDKLKQIYRQSRLADNSREENDAEHSWHLAVMAVILQEYANDPGLNVLKVLKMVLIHDIVEIDAGDTFIYDAKGNQSKAEREKEAAVRLFGLLPEDQGKELRELWEEFETRKTAEAKFAAVLDRLEPLLLNTQTAGHTWKKHGIARDQVLQKNQQVKEGSLALWEYIRSALDECVALGYLDL
jgi:putative hydrolase of HD superfamily